MNISNLTLILLSPDDDAGLITNTAVDRRVLVTRLLEALEDQPLQNEGDFSLIVFIYLS